MNADLEVLPEVMGPGDKAGGGVRAGIRWDRYQLPIGVSQLDFHGDADHLFTLVAVVDLSLLCAVIPDVSISVRDHLQKRRREGYRGNVRACLGTRKNLHVLSEQARVGPVTTLPEKVGLANELFGKGRSEPQCGHGRQKAGKRRRSLECVPQKAL